MDQELLKQLLEVEPGDTKSLLYLIRRAKGENGNTLSKDKLIAQINNFKQELDENSTISKSQLENLVNSLRMKPMRTQSGVTTVTVLTKPYACPGKCIFCPNDIRMPKSYIATEPGAQRALMNSFSPYSQVYNRLKALKAIGHPTQKIELLILGGTWSSYPEKYQIWFVYECFRAMNEFGIGILSDNSLVKNDISSIFKKDFNDEVKNTHDEMEYNFLLHTKEFLEWKKNNVVAEDQISWEDLELEQEKNSHGTTRCVGLVLETRSDRITKDEVIRMRKLGATKVQLGIQILNDEVSDANERGETIEDCANAFQLLRNAGFKIHAHMMPNLYLSTPELDMESYKKIFEDERFCPDEMKIYPTSLIKHTGLDKKWREGKYLPYEKDVLVELVSKMMEFTPRYCRITRVIRDIPSTEIEAGNLTTNLREVVEKKLETEHRENDNIRAREIKTEKVESSDLKLDILKYKTSTSTEYFLEYTTHEDKIAGFLRLSIPNLNEVNEISSELDNCAMIREVHVYGQTMDLQKSSSGASQHLGLGTKLLTKAKEITLEFGFHKLAVISAIGTREYYEKRGFLDGNLWRIANLDI